MEPRFRWLLSGYRGGFAAEGIFRETEGPFQYVNYGGVKTAKYHNLSDLLKLPYSATIKTSLKSAKPGTKIKICYYARGSDLYVQRLTDEEILILEDIEQRKGLVDSIKQVIATAMKKETDQIKDESNKIAKLNRQYQKIVEKIK